MFFDSQPVLKGDLVELGPLRSADYEDLRIVATDPLTYEQHPVGNRHEKASLQELFNETLAPGGIRVGSRPDAGGRDSRAIAGLELDFQEPSMKFIIECDETYVMAIADERFAEGGFTRDGRS